MNYVEPTYTKTGQRGSKNRYPLKRIFRYRRLVTRGVNAALRTSGRFTLQVAPICVSRAPNRTDFVRPQSLDLCDN